MTRPAAALALAFAVLACANGRTPPGDEGAAETPRATRPAGGAADTVALEVERVHATDQSGIDEPLRTVVRTEAEWRDLWSRIAAPRIPPPDPPEIDFARRMAIVAASGTKSTGGHGIAIERVLAVGDTLHVHVLETAPGPGCLTTQALTAPVVVATVERREGEAVFHTRQETRPC